jgi:oligosaccharyltransferase complex subunit alpha (ribophorin I)
MFPVDFWDVKIGKETVKTKVENGKILVPINLKPDEMATLALTLVFSKVLQPLPKKVKQFDKQAFLYKGDVGFYSPYSTQQLRTTVKLPNSLDLVSPLDGPEPVKKNGDEILFGPFMNLEALSMQEAKIHYYSNKSPLSASKVEKIVQVSQLGNSVNFLEYYTLHHKGAE